MAAQATAQQMEWYRNPEFAAARVKAIPPGGSNEYDADRPVGATPTDVTEFIYGQRAWCRTHMPDILYVLKPSQEWRDFRGTGCPPAKIDAQGNVMRERWPDAGKARRNLLDFEILPDRIGSQEHWFIIEAWQRLDPHILMRMNGASRKTLYSIRKRASQKRPTFDLISWNILDTEGNKRIIARLTQAERDANTTRGKTPGLIDPDDVDAGRIAHPDGEDGDDEVYDTEDEYSDEDEVDTEDEGEEDLSIKENDDTEELGDPATTVPGNSGEALDGREWMSESGTRQGSHWIHWSGFDLDDPPGDQ